ncbi:MAG: anaerobic ribonucleoside-triphosphate reductase activating protein [Spirochaetales bacterium]
MKIAGFIKNSLIDYKDKICTTVFTSGCNMNCWYCQNYELLDGKHKDYYSEVMAFLNKRIGQIDAVTISGGEPTIQRDLENFVREVKALGFLVKLDTNGLRPDVLEDLLRKNLLDYVAMDVKAPFEQYSQVTGIQINIEKLKNSIEILKNSKIDYEFRTTFSPDLTLEDIKQIGVIVKGAKNFSLQAYRQSGKTTTNVNILPHKPSIINEGYEIIKQYVPNAKLKGI